MTFEYEAVVPWGRSFDEYRRMFDLSDKDLESRIIGCGDGPAAFNSEMRKLGHPIVSCDPLYRFTTEQIQARIDATYENVINQTRQNRTKFVWNSIKSPDELGRIRMESMHAFLEDYERGKKEGRYLEAGLPDLLLASRSFDLALCSHFLFLYSDNLPFDFHRAAIIEMCRVANETRIFPLLDYNAQQSAYVDPLVDDLEEAGYCVSLQKVSYEFQKGGDQMMRIHTRSVNAGGETGK